MKRASLFSLFLLLCALAGQAFASGGNPGSIASLVRGTPYDRLLAVRDKPLVIPDKGFLPNFGNYFDTTNPGWGLDIQSVGDLLFAVWFTYLADGTPTWYIIVGELEAKGGGMNLTGDIDSFKWDGTQATATTVGTMTIAWTDESNANVSWTLNGNDGAAPVAFAAFAAGPALGNMTGHYFSFFQPGWGFTLLTQGAVTVMTMYWYKGGQPVWAQGVAPTLGFSQFIELQYFLGPGLCPECLPRKGEKGALPTPLADMRVNWSATIPPQTTVAWTGTLFKGTPLGSNPFDDIPLGFIAITTQAITSAFQSNFDPNYSWLPNKGNGCLPFDYDPGFLNTPPGLTGGTATGYVSLDPTPGGSLLVYQDADCLTPFDLPVFDVETASAFRIGPTGDGGVALDWSAIDPFKRARPVRSFSDAKGDEPCDLDKGEYDPELCACEEAEAPEDDSCDFCDGESVIFDIRECSDLNRAGSGALGALIVEGDDKDVDGKDRDDGYDQSSKGIAGVIRLYGSNPYQSQDLGAAVNRFVGDWDDPPSLNSILQNPDADVYIRIPADN